MSRDWLRAVVARRDEAFKNFEHHDDQAVAAVSYSGIRPPNHGFAGDGGLERAEGQSACACGVFFPNQLFIIAQQLS